MAADANADRGLGNLSDLTVRHPAPDASPSVVPTGVYGTVQVGYVPPPIDPAAAGARGEAGGGGAERIDLWCVHVLGPDDVYAAPDVVTAARWAAALNDASKLANQDVSDDDYVICHANVERWDGTAEDHAAYLPQSIALCTPKRGIIPPGQVVEIDYTNHEGRRAVRKIKPTGRMLVGLDKWHPEAPWVIEARDVERGVMRTFNPAKIHRWGPDARALAAPLGAGVVAWTEDHDRAFVRLSQDAFEAYRSDYVFSPDDGSDHELTEWEGVLAEDFVQGYLVSLHEVLRNGLPFAAAPAPAAAGGTGDDLGSVAGLPIKWLCDEPMSLADWLNACLGWIEAGELGLAKAKIEEVAEEVTAREAIHHSDVTPEGVAAVQARAGELRPARDWRVIDDGSAVIERAMAAVGAGEVDDLIRELTRAAGAAEVAAVSDHISGETYAELLVDVTAAETAIRDHFAALCPARPAAPAAVTFTEAEFNEAGEIGERDGYERAVADIDRLTGGDGEYVCSSEPDRNCPSVEAMTARIVERFEALESQPAAPAVGGAGEFPAELAALSFAVRVLTAARSMLEAAEVDGIDLAFCRQRVEDARSQALAEVDGLRARLDAEDRAAARAAERGEGA